MSARAPHRHCRNGRSAFVAAAETDEKQDAAYRSRGEAVEYVPSPAPVDRTRDSHCITCEWSTSALCAFLKLALSSSVPAAAWHVEQPDYRTASASRRRPGSADRPADCSSL